MMSAKQPQKPKSQRAQFLALALLAGTAAAALAYVGMARQADSAARSSQLAAVVVAAQALPPRQVLTPAMLHTISLPSADAPPNAFHAAASLAGRVTIAAIAAGQPISEALVTTRDQTAGLAPQITPSLRAISIPLDSAGGAAGFLEPGDHVDVFATFEEASGQSVAKLIVGDARLLTLGNHSGPTETSDTPATSAILEVTSPDALALALASARGRLTLALRGLGDDSHTTLPPWPATTLADKATAKPAMPAPVLPPPRPTAMVPPQPAPVPTTPLPEITVVRGTQKTTMQVGE